MEECLRNALEKGLLDNDVACSQHVATLVGAASLDIEVGFIKLCAFCFRRKKKLFQCS